MKFLIFLWCILIIYLTKLPKVDAEVLQPQCHDPETDHYWPVGGNYRPIGRCVTFHCFADRQKNAKSCSAFYPSYGCTVIPEDLSKPYPQCCAKASCP